MSTPATKLNLRASYGNSLKPFPMSPKALASLDNGDGLADARVGKLMTGRVEDPFKKANGFMATAPKRTTYTLEDPLKKSENEYSSAQELPPHPCTQCHRPNSSYYTHKTCLKCREKDRKKRQRLKSRRKNELARFDEAHWPDNVKTSTGKGDGLKLTKRKAEVYSDLDEDEDAVVSEVQKRLKKAEEKLASEKASPKSAQTINPTPTNDPSVMTEYQLSSELHTTLTSLLTTSLSTGDLVNFRGTYSIIKNPSIGNERRIQKVSRELRRSAKLHHSMTGTTINKSPSNHRQIFKCNCGGKTFLSAETPSMKPILSTPPTTQSSDIAKPSKNDLSRYFASSQPSTSQIKSASPDNLNKGDEEEGCGGWVRICAQDDGSHLLAIEGQKVIIEVEHPDPNCKRGLNLDRFKMEGK